MDKRTGTAPFARVLAFAKQTNFKTYLPLQTSGVIYILRLLPRKGKEINFKQDAEQDNNTPDKIITSNR